MARLTPDIRLVVFCSSTDPVHPEAHYTAFADLSDAELTRLAAEALNDWPSDAGTSVDLTQANYETIAECGVSVTHGGKLLAEPGCCSTLSGAIALRDFMRKPQVGTHTLFTGHDVDSFLQLRFDPANAEQIELLVGPNHESSTSFYFSTSEAQALAATLTAEIDSAIERLSEVLPVSISNPDRGSVAEYLLGVEGVRFW